MLKFVAGNFQANNCSSGLVSHFTKSMIAAIVSYDLIILIELISVFNKSRVIYEMAI